MTQTTSPINFFASVTDPRVERTQKHSLDSILFISLCAVICGAESWNEIEDYGNAKIDWLEKFLYLPNGIPSHDTFNRVISMLDPKELNDSFVAWTKSIAELTDGEVVAIDGKCLRGSSDEGTGTYTHPVSAWASANNLLLAQEKVAGKSNEITAIPRLLRILELKNCIVTIDAMGCQREIAKTIIDRGADYILALKGNQPEMLDRVSGSFTYIKPSSVHTMEGKSHGREERRICSVITNLENIVDKEKWPGLKSLVRIESHMRDIKSGESHKETRYYISSLEADAQCINHSIRTHWCVENQIHWTLDVAFGDDASRKQKDNAAQNFSLLNRIGLNIIKNAKVSSMGVKGHRKKAGWDNDYLLYALKSFDVIKN